MSKKHGKTRQPNPNRARSKNNPKGKRNDPKTNWSEYNKGRSQEGELFVHWMTQIAIFAREIIGIAPGTRDRRVSAILVSILKSKEKLSYWELVNHFVKYPVCMERCEISRQYHTSWYHLRVSEIDPAVLQKIITRMADNRAVHDILLTDSSVQCSKVH